MAGTVAGALAVWAVPVFIMLILTVALARRVPVFDEFTSGAADGLKSCIKILPSLVALMTAVAMLRASGLLDMLVALLAPAANAVGIPPEVIPLGLLRPVSGSGSIAMLESMYSMYGPDSTVGRIASVMQSSTETTFYTIAVYYGSVGVKKTGHTLAAAAGGDITGIIVSALMVSVLF